MRSAPSIPIIVDGLAAAGPLSAGCLISSLARRRLLCDRVNNARVTRRCCIAKLLSLSVFSRASAVGLRTVMHDFERCTGLRR